MAYIKLEDIKTDIKIVNDINHAKTRYYSTNLIWDDIAKQPIVVDENLNLIWGHSDYKFLITQGYKDIQIPDKCIRKLEKLERT
jgi:hypothetical protein